MVSFLYAIVRQTPQCLSLEIPHLNRLDFEMQSNQGKYQCLQVLDEIVENTQALGVLRFGNIDERTNLGGLWRYSGQHTLTEYAKQLSLPQKRCVHYLAGSPIPVYHPYSSGAICHHLPCSIVSLSCAMRNPE